MVTRAEGREAIEIDGRPAAEVYIEWAGAELAKQLGAADAASLTPASLATENLLALSTLRPLASVTDGEDGKPFHTLLHPSGVTERGGLTFFGGWVGHTSCLCMSYTNCTLYPHDNPSFTYPLPAVPAQGDELVCMSGTSNDLSALTAGDAAGRGDV